jgi:PAS domain S-box-containing protein
MNELNPLAPQELIEHLQVGICRTTTGASASLVYANAAFCAMFELDARKITQVTIEHLFAERSIYIVLRKKIRKEGAVPEFEAQLKTSNNKLFWGSFSVLKGKDRDNNPWLDIVIQDITSRKQIERELIESKDLFQTVFNNTAEAIMVTDKEERIVAWNPFAERMLGMTKKDLFNKPAKDLYPEKEWQRIRSSRVRRRGSLDDIETKIIKKDGNVLDANVSISVLKDLDGGVIGFIGIIRDITFRKMNERKLKESENKIRVILDNSAAAITLTDDQERIISWNRFTERLFGMRKKDLYLRPVSSLYPAKEWTKIHSGNIRQIESKQHLETQIIRKDGEVIDVELSINVLRDAQNKIVGSVGMIQDITKQKQFRQQLLQAKLIAEEANNTKSLFLANMSHEVRTPMNTIIGMIDLTLDTPLSPEQKENLQVVKDAADNLLGLLNDILDLSRVEAGKITLENIEFHLPNVVKNICKGLDVLAKKKKLGIVLNIDAQVPELILGDPVRLRQVIINLVNNAIKFTSQGVIEIGVKTLSLIPAKGEIVIQFSVRDEGIGIPEDKYEKIFEVFTQADESTTRKYGGTGLGLAISKRLVEMMGGQIWVESAEGKRSTFFFTGVFKVIAQKAAEAPDAKQQEEKIDEAALPPIKELKILLAEDNLVNQKITARILEKQGWQVAAVANGKEVIERLDREPFDVVLMDVQMPVLDGLEATKIIRENEKSTGKHVPIIALTARAMKEEKESFVESGMDGYVSKPIDRKKLFEEIENIINKVRSS